MSDKVLEVLQAGWRRSGLIGLGVTINAAQKTVGLERLQDLYEDMAEGLFGRLTDKRLTTAAAYEAQEFERVLNTAAAVVTLPETVTDPVDGCSRTPLDGAIIVVGVPGSDPTINIYESNRAEWQDVSSLALNDVAPLSGRFSDSLKNLLATFLLDDIGGQVSPVLAKRASTARLKIGSRYGSLRRSSPSEFF